MENLDKNWYDRFLNIAWRQVAIVTACVVVGYFLLDLAVMPLYTRQYQAISVPNVVFQSFNEAEKTLHQSGLRIVKDGEKFDETLPAGKIVFQNPEASATVKKGRRIYVTVSKGGRTFEMPKLIGFALRDVRFIIQDHELSLGLIHYRRDPFLPDGVVCDQSLAAGRTVGVQSRVDITVSLGVEPTEFIVPNLVGKSEEDALMELQKAGLTTGIIRQQATEELLPSTVISQSLQAGQQVAKGDTVHIVVSVLP
jgi:eukaryotic-like serine/threonine-protein kinase